MSARSPFAPNLTPKISRPGQSPRKLTRRAVCPPYTGIWKARDHYGDLDDPDLLVEQQRFLRTENNTLIEENKILASAVASAIFAHDCREAAEIDTKTHYCSELDSSRQQERAFLSSKRVMSLEAEIVELDKQIAYLSAYFSAESLETLKTEVGFERYRINLLKGKGAIYREVHTVAEDRFQCPALSQNKSLFGQQLGRLNDLKNSLDQHGRLNAKLAEQLKFETKEATRRMAETESPVEKLEQQLFTVRHQRELKENERDLLRKTLRRETDIVRQAKRFSIVDRQLSRKAKGETRVVYPLKSHYTRPWPAGEPARPAEEDTDLFQITAAETGGEQDVVAEDGVEPENPANENEGDTEEMSKTKETEDDDPERNEEEDQEEDERDETGDTEQLDGAEREEAGTVEQENASQNELGDFDFGFDG
jgi:hypothetical protein